MILNKEKGKRMWGSSGGSGGSGGSGFDPSSLSGYAQQSWVNDNFVSKAFFNQMFELQYSQRVLTKDGETVIDDETTDLVATPNTFIDTTTQTRTDEETGYTIQTTNTITGIKAKVGLWTPSYLSALGQNTSGGGGGGGSLNEPLLSINKSGLSAPGASQNGMTIVWDNATQKWKYGAAGGGSYALPLAANGTRGGIQIGFTTDGSNRNYAVLLSNEKAYVNVPWTDTNTWRPVQDNLTSTSASDSLSANQGRVLKGYIDTLNGYFTDGSAKTALKLATARTIWGQSFDGSANVSGNMSDVLNIAMTGSISGTQSIEMNTNGFAAGHGGFIDFHYEGSDVDYSTRIIEEESGRLTIQSKATVADPTKGISKGDFIPSGLIISGGHDESFLQIGDIRLIYDQENNAIKAEKYNGQSANFYATGGVSALGVPTSGSGTIDTLNVNTLKAANNLYIGDSSNEIFYNYDDDVLTISSGSGDIALDGSIIMTGRNPSLRSINTQGGQVLLDGGFLYLTNSVYLFFESNNVKVSINGTIYTLNKS